ncbi:MAG: NTP transferase domain-containing protein [Elusimicrobia bacterium]|nr:NTP transferase domain-containing protein [Elusimicrobiota bacterium]
MNSIRPREILDILQLLRAIESAAGGGTRTVLATFVTLDGSVFSRAGVMAVFVPTAGFSGDGIIAVTELQGPLRREIDAVAAGGGPRLAVLDLAEDDPVLALGLGPPGRVEVLLEPVDDRVREHFIAMRESLLRNEGVVCGLEIEGSDLGRRWLYRADDPQVKECYEEISPELVETSVAGRVQRTFLCPVHPMGKALVFGSGPVAAALSRHLAELGFSVFAADPRPGRLKGPDWQIPGVALIEGGWDQARSVAQPDEETSVAVLTRSYALDLETLQGALKSPASYVGIIGPQKRTLRLLAELAALETRPRPGVFFAPAGLDIGAEAPAETALSIAAEILAARSGRKGGRLSSRRGGVPVARTRARVPGLILAAGAGTRFAGGSKLSALFEGKPILRHVVDNALATRLDPVIVVLGCAAQEGLQALAGIKDPRLRVVFNPLWEGGQTSSLEVGLREMPHHAPGAIKLLGDMPLVKPWLIERVLSEFELSGRLAFPVYEGPDGPEGGFPLAIPRSLFGEVKLLARDDSDEAAAREHWAEAVRIPLADGRSQADIDTAADLAELARPA